MFPGVSNRGDFPFDPARAKPAGNQDAIDLAQDTLGPLPFNLLRFDPLDVHPRFMVDAPVDERLRETLITFPQARVLAHEGD